MVRIHVGQPKFRKSDDIEIQLHKFRTDSKIATARSKIFWRNQGTAPEGFAFCRISFKIVGKRRMLTFGTYGEAEKVAMEKSVNFTRASNRLD